MKSPLLIVFTIFDDDTEDYLENFCSENLPENRKKWNYLPVLYNNEYAIIFINDLNESSTDTTNFLQTLDFNGSIYVLYHKSNKNLGNRKLFIEKYFTDNSIYCFKDVHHDYTLPSFTQQLENLSKAYKENITTFAKLFETTLKAYDWIPDTINKELSKLNTIFLEKLNSQISQSKTETPVSDRKVIVIWDKAFATDKLIEQKLKSFFLFALAEKHKLFQPENLIFKTDYEDLLKSVSGSDIVFSDYELIIIHAELSSKDYKPGQFKGVEMAKNLRLAGIKKPVLICSCFDKYYFYEQNKLDYNVLKTPSTYFIHLPSQIIDLKTENSIAELDDKTLDDLKFYELQANGFYHEILHTYKRQFQNILTNAAGFEKLFDQFCSAVLPLIANANDKNLFIVNTVEVKQYVQNSAVKNEEKEEKLNRFYKDTEKFIPCSSSKHEAYKNNEFKTDWNVLYIDDDEKCRNELKEIFDNYQISYVPYSTTQTFPANGEDAFTMLTNDCNDYKEVVEEDAKPQKDLRKIKGKSKITVVITDWRFINKYGEWDKYQGLKIIDHIVNDLNSFVAFFILTEKTGGINKFLKTYQDAKVISFTKTEIKTPDGLYRFVETLRSEGNKMYNRIQRMPDTKWWNKPNKRMKANKSYKDYYRYFIMYDFKKEFQIGQDANEYIEQAIKYKEDIGGKNVTLSTIAKPKPEFFLEPTGDLSSENYFENYQKFIKRLIARRIALGLTILEWDKNEIGRMLLSDTGSSRKDLNYSELFTQGLAMFGKIGALIDNKKILLEEQNWLKFKFNVNFSREAICLRKELSILFMRTQKNIKTKYENLGTLEHPKYKSAVESLNKINFKKIFLSTALITTILTQISKLFNNKENHFQRNKKVFIAQWKKIALNKEYQKIIKKNKWNEIIDKSI